MALEAKEHEELLMNWAVAFFTYLGYTVMIVVGVTSRAVVVLPYHVFYYPMVFLRWDEFAIS